MVLSLFVTFSVFAGLKIGYSDFTAGSGCPTFQQCAAAGYNIVIVAFGTVSTTGSVSLTYYGPYSNLSQLTSAITTAKQTYPQLKVLISFGGQNNTWNPSSSVNAQTLGTALANFCTSNNFDGIDFDLETAVTDTYINSVIVQIKATAPSLMITAAPQAVVNNQGYFVTTGWNYGYNASIIAGNYTYVWPQFYNNTWCSINGVTETSASYIPLWFNNVAPTTANPSGTGLPSSITWIVGLPATPEAGNGCVGVDTNANITNMLKNYAGTMTWSTNADMANNWNMVKNIMP